MRRPNEQQMDKRNKGKRSTSATAREIAAAVSELKLADQAINKVRRHISPLAPEREITAAVIDLGAVTQVIYKAVRHIGKAVQIRRSEIRCAKLKKRNG
jgi:hypothetical protein